MFAVHLCFATWALIGMSQTSTHVVYVCLAWSCMWREMPQRSNATDCAGAGVYAVLGRRRARIVREELREGSGHFSVHAFLPMQARLVPNLPLTYTLSPDPNPILL